MPEKMKKKEVKRKKEVGAVELIADGSNKVLLVFPKGSKLKGTKTLSATKVAKILGVGTGADVEGQCGAICPRQCIDFGGGVL